MIRLLSPEEIPLFEECSVFSARLHTLHQSWRGLLHQPDSPDFYRAGSSAWLSLWGGVSILDGLDFSPSELAAFLRACGCQTLICSWQAWQRLSPGVPPSACYPLLRWDGGPPPCEQGVDLSPRLDQVYPLLAAVFENMRDVPFGRWYPDTALKLRRGTALVAGIRQGEELLSTAGIYHQNSKAALLGSVATRPEARGRGLATRLIYTLIAQAVGQGRVPFIAALNPHAQGLYLRLGFQPHGFLCEHGFSSPHRAG